MQMNTYLAAVALAMGVAAHAGPHPEPPPPTPQEPGMLESYEPTDPAEVERYWTKERMEAAQPMPFPQVEIPPDGGPPQEQTQAPEGPPVSIPGQPPSVEH